MFSLEYLAGFVDGEGSLSLNRIPRLGRSTEYCTRFTIVNSNLWILEEIQKELGGTIADVGQRNSKWKVVYALIWTNSAAERLLRNLAPILRVKARQAEALLAFADHKDGYKRRRDAEGRLIPLAIDELEARERYFWCLRGINAKGPGLKIPEPAQQLADTFNVKALGKISAGYLAGFIDGEGALMIARSFSGRYLSHSYRARVAVTNTNQQVIGDIHRDFGGILIDQPSRAPNWKDGYGVVWTDAMVEPLLTAIGSNLKLKVKQVQLLLQFVEHKRSTYKELVGRPSGHLPEEIIDIREAFYQEMRRLNARGPKRETLPTIEHQPISIKEIWPDGALPWNTTPSPS